MDAARAKSGKVALTPDDVAKVEPPQVTDTPIGDELAASEAGVAAEAARTALAAGLVRLHELLPETGQEMDGNGEGTGAAGRHADVRAGEQAAR